MENPPLNLAVQVETTSASVDNNNKKKSKPQMEKPVKLMATVGTE